MKSLTLILLALALTAPLHAGITGWLTSETRDWQFIQKSGGIRLGPVIEQSGASVLPVYYWPEGDSGLAVRKIKIARTGSALVIRVVTQVVEEGSDTGSVHFVYLTGFPRGAYEVFYETAGDRSKYPGTVQVGLEVP